MFVDGELNVRVEFFPVWQVYCVNHREWTDSYQTMDSNQYTPELLQSVLSASKKLNEVNHDDYILSQLHKQLAKVNWFCFLASCIHIINIHL